MKIYQFSFSKKFLIFSVFWVFSLLFSETASSQTIKTGSSLEVPFCYMQTKEGKIIDLTKICGQTPPSPILDSVPSTESRIDYNNLPKELLPNNPNIDYNNLPEELLPK